MFNITEVSEQWAKQEGFSVDRFDVLNSTNSFAKAQLESFENFPHIVLTEQQTQGRGRGTNTWVSTGDGDSLLCSISFKLDGPPQPIATPCFGWAVYRALSESFNLDFSVKAPNDIYIEISKIGGLLLESVSKGDEHNLIFGLGLNIFSHPSVDNSNALLNFMDGADVQENQWLQFLSLLLPLSRQAATACTEEHMSQIIVEELEAALKKYARNEIDKLMTDGSFVLTDGTTSHWREL